MDVGSFLVRKGSMGNKVFVGRWIETREDFPLGIQCLEVWSDPIMIDVQAWVQTKDGDWELINIKM